MGVSLGVPFLVLDAQSITTLWQGGSSSRTVPTDEPLAKRLRFAMVERGEDVNDVAG
jgi:hypothetical protein